MDMLQFFLGHHPAWSLKILCTTKVGFGFNLTFEDDSVMYTYYTNMVITTSHNKTVRHAEKGKAW